ncbi:MAG: molybdopterin molybdotransferase MoeA [Acidobacteriota bacterium]|nr:molybdopterin molybdotransferase MoeA [Acidobacteriota bacterium]
MISYDDARAYVLSLIEALEPRPLALDDALGCVIAQRVVATEAVPGFANSSMDGYALRADDTRDVPTRLRVTGTTLAGAAPSAPVAPGEARRIMTGAPLPPGADSVFMIEEVDVLDEGRVVVIPRRASRGQNVRQPGEDVTPGDVLVVDGDVLSPPRIGVLASQGVRTVLARPRPRVGVVSTGNELITEGGPLGPGQIRDTNGPLVRALLRDAGFQAVDLGVALDDEAATTALLAAGAATCDAVISTGGVSVGDVDHVKAAITHLGGERSRWMQIALRPGKPFAVGVTAASTPLFGLPGNPVSTRVSFELFVRPALRRMAGHRDVDRPRVRAVLDVALTRNHDQKLHVLHARVVVGDDGRWHVVELVRHGSHLLHAIARANAMLLYPEGPDLATGDEVEVLLLSMESLNGEVE